MLMGRACMASRVAGACIPGAYWKGLVSELMMVGVDWLVVGGFGGGGRLGCRRVDGV